MKKFHEKRLLKLASLLEIVPRERFDLDVIAEVDVEQPLFPALDLPKTCGTTACAMGLCPILFKGKVKYVKAFNWNAKPNRDSYSVDFEGDTDFHGASLFFGLKNGFNDAEYLFSPYAYRPGHRGAKSVASRIRDYVAKKGKVSQNTKEYNLSYD